MKTHTQTQTSASACRTNGLNLYMENVWYMRMHHGLAARQRDVIIHSLSVCTSVPEKKKRKIYRCAPKCLCAPDIA